MSEQELAAFLVLAGSIGWAVSVLCLVGWSAIEYGNRRIHHCLASLACAVVIVGLGLLAIRSNP